MHKAHHRIRVTHAHEKTMTAERVLEIHADLAGIGVEIILDGGWGVDALLGKQTRPHKDIDFLIEKGDLQKVRHFFLSRGYKDKDPHHVWWHFILESKDATVDTHVIDLDEAGRGIYGPKKNHAVFPAYALQGHGEINGVKVRCLSAGYRVRCLTEDYGVVTRTGYELKESDYIDISAICKKFDIKLPEDFVNFRKTHKIRA